jgi:hypothetical protein
MKNYNKPSDEELRRKLTPRQYEVTQHDATEPPFQNEYWNFNGEGIYVDVVSGEPLFSSFDKFDSHCGWASFSKPLEDNITEYSEWRGRKFVQNTPIRIWDTFLTTDHLSAAVCATASIRRQFVLSQKKNSKRKATENISRFLKMNNLNRL